MAKGFEHAIVVAVLGLLCSFSLSVFAQTNIVITSFQSNGLLAWTNQLGSGRLRVEWASAPTGIWCSSWGSLANRNATSEATRVHVPMFYRVACQDIPNVLQKEQALEIGTGTEFSYSGLLSNTPCRKGSVSVIADNSVLTDSDGSGALTGDGSGTINYMTGVVEVYFTLAPSDGNPITTTYATWSEGMELSSTEAIAVGDNATVTFTGTLQHVPAIFDSVLITDGVETFTDIGATTVDGREFLEKVRLVGDRNGVAYLNYFTGEVDVTFFTAPSLGQSVMAYYQYLAE